MNAGMPSDPLFKSCSDLRETSEIELYHSMCVTLTTYCSKLVQELGKFWTKMGFRFLLNICVMTGFRFGHLGFRSFDENKTGQTGGQPYSK